MMFIDDIDEDQLSIQAWAFVDKHGWIGQIEAPYQVRDALYKGFYAGYEQARKDEKQMYDKAIKLIQESQNRQRCQDLAAIFRLLEPPKEEK